MPRRPLNKGGLFEVFFTVKTFLYSSIASKIAPILSPSDTPTTNLTNQKNFIQLSKKKGLNTDIIFDLGVK